MDKSQERIVEVNLRAVAALAESLAEDLKNGKLWEGDCSRRIGVISEHLNTASHSARNDR